MSELNAGKNKRDYTEADLAGPQPVYINANDSSRDLYKSCHIADRVLNAAIVQADISGSFEEYIEIFDRFYGDDIEVSSDTGKEPIRGKDGVRSILLDFLVPLHVVAEIGGVLISIRETAIIGDAVGETHSAWTLDLVGASGNTCTLSWRTFRKWEGLRVVREHHYDHQQSGGPLTFEDMRFSAENNARPHDSDCQQCRTLVSVL